MAPADGGQRENMPPKDDQYRELSLDPQFHSHQATGEFHDPPIEGR